MLRADIAAIGLHKGRLLPFLFPNLFAVATYRIAAQLRARGRVRLARVVSIVGQVLTGAEIDPAATIGPGLLLDHTVGVVIGPGVTAGHGLRLFGGTVVGAAFNKDGWPVLGDNVTVLAKASIVGPVTVGDDAMVGAHALVVRDVPAGHCAIGVPAICKPRSERPQVDENEAA